MTFVIRFYEQKQNYVSDSTPKQNILIYTSNKKVCFDTHRFKYMIIFFLLKNNIHSIIQIDKITSTKNIIIQIC